MTRELTVSSDEFNRDSYAPESLDLGVDIFRDAGYVLVKRAFEPAFIQELQNVFFEKYGGTDEADLRLTRASAKVGDARYMISLPMKGPFCDPRLFANPFVLSLLEPLLGKDFLINSLSCVVAYPGAKKQSIHVDHHFQEGELVSELEIPAINLSIPLVNLSERTGTTAMFPGTHKISANNPWTNEMRRSELPFAQMGDCYFMDYRLWHYGTENLSDEVRPIVYIVYSRPWFDDAANFVGRPSINLSATELEKIRPRYAGLFKRVIENTGAARLS